MEIKSVMLGSELSSFLQPTAVQPFMLRRGFSLTMIQAVLLGTLLAFGFILLVATVDIALPNTLLIFMFEIFAGLWLCNRTCLTVADPKLKILSTFWLIKLAATLIILYVGWIPQLDPDSISWGYDPQRYFQDSWFLIENDWNPVVGQNYQGIIFYYAVIFSLFGHNPIIPALINAFVTLLGTLFLIRCAYAFVYSRTNKDWWISGLLLVPEVLWYDVMTSRETLMAILILVVALAAGRYIVDVGRTSLLSTLMLTSSCFVAILVVRTSMAIPLAVIIVVMALVLKFRLKMGPAVKVLVIVLGVGALSAGPLIQRLTGGYDINYLAMMDRVLSFENSIASQMEWSDDSIGLLMAPNNAWQSMALLLPRMLMYLAAPLPNVALSISDLVNGSWNAWQRLMTISTSALILLGFPYVLAGSAQAWRQRKQFPAMLIVPITFWITFAAVVVGNIIIHERYRLMTTLPLFTCMWLGYTRCHPRRVQRWAFLWFGLLAMGAVFYMVYKYL